MSEGPWDIVIPPLGSNPVYDEDYLRHQTKKNLVDLDRRLSRSIADLNSYQGLVRAELAKRDEA